MSVAMLTEKKRHSKAEAGPGGPSDRRPRVRSDSLPEFTRYRDDGCDIHPSCLSCPLPRCRYEEPGGLRALLNEYRDRQMVQLRLKGLGVDELAQQFNVSKRTVFRVLGANGLSGGDRSPDRGGKPVPIHGIRDRRNESQREVQCA